MDFKVLFLVTMFYKETDHKMVVFNKSPNYYRIVNKVLVISKFSAIHPSREFYIPEISMHENNFIFV
jgi:hypothetical protein